MNKVFLNLGRQPLANSFLKNIKKNTLKNEFFYNLKICFNKKNYLVSIKKPVNPKKQYTDKYAHRASESKTMRAAFKNVAKKLFKRFKPKKIMEIGSNDGVFLKNFNKKAVTAIEPCKNLAKITKKMFKTYDEFWNLKLSKKLINQKRGKMDLIFSANTISHIPNLEETFKGINNILSKDGVLVIEDPSLLKVITNNSYDQFYDEHVYVFSVISINNIVKDYGLRLFDVDHIETHGGSNRYYICKKNSKYKNSLKLKKAIKKEIYSKLNKFNSYNNFAKRVIASKKKLNYLLKNLKKNNKKIISYGATYKSTTVFNYCKINTKTIDYVTDTTLNKQGKYTPGTHIKIIPPEKGIDDTVDYAFLGAWNFKKEIFKKEKNFLMRGGRFITHVPKVMVLKND
ncbi:class I SAM-dependent methyltransferase [Candidatus Pelagibacter sp.]|nr:class I SAM-dependent methyltransferase [Candidatus Pelagibacter sp.]